MLLFGTCCWALLLKLKVVKSKEQVLESLLYNFFYYLVCDAFDDLQAVTTTPGLAVDLRCMILELSS